MKKLICMLMLALTWSSGSRADQPSVHGMLLFGDKVTYASHLPMFHAPHDYQVILKLSLNDTAYDAAKKSSKEIFTLVPEAMDLTKIISGEMKSFKADIYQGHFEKGGTKIGPVKVLVEDVVFAKKLDSQMTGLENKYLLFGEANEYFAAHLIYGKPNFDAILSVSQPYKIFAIEHCRTRVCAEPIFDKVPVGLPQIVAASYRTVKVPAVGQTLGMFKGVMADVQKIIYVEEDELSH